MIIDGQKIAQEILDRVKLRVDNLRKKGKNLRIVCILVGNDKSSLSFIRKKKTLCEEAGIAFELKQFSENISENELLGQLQILQKNANGTIVQLPLPNHLNKAKILGAIRPEFDVDCLAPENLGLLVSGNPKILPPAANAVLHILKIHNVDFVGKNIVIVGRGDLVGKPLAILLTQCNSTVISCNRQTKNLGELTKQADILISCAGVARLIKKEMVRRGAVVLDVGTNYCKGKLCGDVDFENVKNIASLITPVPGGVGPVMVAKLLENVVILNER